VLLASHLLFRTSDLDDARESVARIFCPHRLDLERGAHQLAAVHNAVALDTVTLSYLDYGAPVQIEPGELDSFFLIQIPLAGQARIACGGSEIVSTPRLASVPTPTEHLKMNWGADNPQLIVKFDRQTVQHALQQMLDRPLTGPIRFELGMDLTTPAAQSWLSLVRLLATEAEHGLGLVRQPLALAQLEAALLSSLLLGQPSNYSSWLHASGPPAPPKIVARAMELIETLAQTPLTTEQLARTLGVGVRTLQEGFARHLGCSPMAYLRDTRLQRVHHELRAGGPGGQTVNDTALSWGFFHQGRFAAAYRAKFGQSPSQTLRGR
jgi:AraC-like DNA-binding protein